METLVAIVIGGGAVLFFLWLIGGRRPATTSSEQAPKVGTLTGLMGGSVEDAATAQFALKSMEAKTGQTPTTRDLGTAVGMTLGASGNEAAEETKE